MDRTNLPELSLTENQQKVIKDKYLKDSPTPEDWLFTITENIALADIFHTDNPLISEIFDGVTYTIKEGEAPPGYTAKMFLLHHGIHNFEDREKNFRQFMSNLYRISDQDHYKDVVSQSHKRFYRLLSSFEFLPNSPTLMNAGRALQQLSACYVLPVEDSIDGIYDSVKNMAIIHKSGGGTGFSFSRLRPARDEVRTTRGVSSGPVSFMGIFDKSTEVVKQGGTRRGANMGILRYDHPDIMQFITCKNEKGFLENFNISVAIDEKFMHAVKNNESYDLINPRTKAPVRKLNAKEVFDSMIKNAWATGDPGFVVIDRINNSDSNPTPHIGQIESTNPCGEQPLLPYEPCNLGSINLSKFANSERSDMDWERLRECVHTAVHFLDNVIDVNNYPLPQIEDLAKGNRRIGLGVMGWAETLALIRIPYNDEKALALAEKTMKFINDNALEASETLARKRGVFPYYKGCIYDHDSPHFRGVDAKPRHSARTTIAPTGTIGITAGLQGAGIEPFFAVVYIRYNAAGIDALKKGEKPKEGDTFYEINPTFKMIAEQNNYFGLGQDELWKKIDENHKSVVGIKEIPEDIQKIFLTSHDLSPLDHVRIQCAFQKYTNNAVSKTVNLRREADISAVEEVYMLAYENGAKGVTIYRDGSKDFQILNLSSKEEKKEKLIRRSGLGEHSAYYEIPTGQGALHVHINYDEEGPTKIFANISPMGTEISGLTGALGILLSKYFQLGGDPSGIIRHLNSVKGDRPFGFGGNRVDSIPHGISKALRDHLIKTKRLTQVNGQVLLENGQQTLSGVNGAAVQPNGGSTLYCPSCFSSNVALLSGCSGPTCYDCGHSECS